MMFGFIMMMTQHNTGLQLTASVVNCCSVHYSCCNRYYFLLFQPAYAFRSLAHIDCSQKGDSFVCMLSLRGIGLAGSSYGTLLASIHSLRVIIIRIYEHASCTCYDAVGSMRQVLLSTGWWLYSSCWQ